jgi:hypothetical protein
MRARVPLSARIRSSNMRNRANSRACTLEYSLTGYDLVNARGLRWPNPWWIPARSLTRRIFLAGLPSGSPKYRGPGDPFHFRVITSTRSLTSRSRYQHVVKSLPRNVVEGGQHTQRHVCCTSDVPRREAPGFAFGPSTTPHVTAVRPQSVSYLACSSQYCRRGMALR